MRKEHAMSARQSHSNPRFRLATNDNETVVDELDVEGNALTRNDNETVVDELDVEGNSLTRNDNETVVEDDTEAHRLAANDNETTVRGARRVEGDDED
jgi:hypothetical protein